MKIVVCQGEAIGGEPSRDKLIEYWKEQLADCSDLEVVYRNGFDFNTESKTFEEAAA